MLIKSKKNFDHPPFWEWKCFRRKIMSVMVLDPSSNFLAHHIFVMMKIEDFEIFIHDPTLP